MASTSETRGRHGRRAATAPPASTLGIRSGKPGRRRAASRKSPLEHLWQAAPMAPSQRAAAVAVAGVLITATAPAQNMDLTELSPEAEASSTSLRFDTGQRFGARSVSVAGDLSALSFTKVSATSQINPTKSTKPSRDTLKVDASADKVGAIDDPAAAKVFAASQLARFGWGQDQMSCLSSLWEKESGWRTTAENPSSLAYGIAQSLPAQKMASAGADYRTNYKTQVSWGLDYIKERYGSPCRAWGHSQTTGWY